MTPQELNAVRALTKAINGLTAELKTRNASIASQSAVFADNLRYLEEPRDVKDD